MKIVNVIVVWDVYVIADDAEEYQPPVDAVLMHIREGLPHSEAKGIEVRDEKAIRTKWRDEKPLVTAGVTDEDFAQLKGKTVIQTFEMLHTKQAPAKKAADK